MTKPWALTVAASTLAVPAVLFAPSAHAETADTASIKAISDHMTCKAGGCSMQLTPAQLLAMTERMVGDKQFEEARPLIAALRVAPGMEVQARFLEGMIALETGDNKTAVTEFRAILAEQPGLTRVRLELARALIASGDLSAADYHLKLAENDGELPQDIARQVRLARNIIRSQRRWQFGIDLGIAPDTNINSATSAETVDVNFGPTRIPLTLDPNAQAKSGIGITASMFGSLRLPVSRSAAMVFDFDAGMVNYDGKQYDDYTVRLAAGPELRASKQTAVTLQGVGLMRWYGGQVAARQAGVKLRVQHELGKSQRLGFQFDARHSDSDFGPGYTGWQFSASASYEKVVGKSAIASVSLYRRRDLMMLESHSSITNGFSLGIGAELPLGINAGLSGGAARTVYDAPQPFFSTENRKDTRYNARAYAGLRKIRMLGFSPSVEYQFQKTDTNYTLYQSTRHRVQFKLARYF